MAKGAKTQRGTFLSEGAELIDESEVWSNMDPQGLLEKLFHCFKQEHEFIARRPDRAAQRELRDRIAQDPDAVNLIFRDYDSNTAMRSLKYTKGGLIKFKEYYTALLDEEGVRVDKI